MCRLVMAEDNKNAPEIFSMKTSASDLDKSLALPKKLDSKNKTPTQEIAYLAGGCFWGLEDLIRKLPGVSDVEAGYTGGKTKDPNDSLVHTGMTGHAETIKVTFDSQIISYAVLLKYFFRIHDPTTLNRQGNDRGTQYRSAVFYLNEEQRKIAEKTKTEIDSSGKWKDPVVTEISQAGEWIKAEDYHQDYLEKHPGGYSCHYERE